jgi:hypothetical protein
MANNNSISQFKTGFNGGTRANRFEVVAEWPSGIGTDANVDSFQIIATQLPQVQVNTITIPYRGRPVNYAGDRQYSPWSITVYDDNNTNNLWRAFHKWKEALDGHVTHTVQNNDYSYSNLQTIWKIKQLDLNAGTSPTRQISLYNCWPSVIGEISLNMGSPDFTTFTVQMVFDYIKYDAGLND